MSFRSVIVLIFLLGTTTVFAQINKWVDEQGNTHYGSQPPAGLDTKSIKQASPASGDYLPASQAASVVLYSTSWCGYCKQARAYMAKNGIAYAEYDIEKSLSAKLDYDRAGGRGVPFLVRGDDVIAGFRKQTYDVFFTKPKK